MQPFLASLIAVALLAGCTSPGPAGGAEGPVTGPDQGTTAAPPKDILDLVVIPLEEALDGELFVLDLAPGWASATVRFVRVGQYSGDTFQNSPLCIKYATPTKQGQAGDRCPVPPGNIAVQVEGPVRVGPEVLLSWSDGQLEPGHHEFRVHSDPQLNDLRFEVTVDYPDSAN